jgi:hypothetical protein
MMRFTSRDPVFGKQQEPLTLHKYLYCANSPVDRIDPDGRFAIGAVSAILTGTALYAQGMELATYAVDSGNWKFFDLAQATFEFIPTAMTIAVVNGSPHGIDTLARALKMKCWRNKFMRNFVKDWLIGESVEAISPTGLSFAEGLAMDSMAYYFYSALLFGERLENGVSAEEMGDYAEWKRNY